MLPFRLRNIFVRCRWRRGRVMFLPGGGGTMLVCGRLGGWGGGGRGRCGGRRDGGGRRDRGPFLNCLLACGCGFGKVDLLFTHCYTEAVALTLVRIGFLFSSILFSANERTRNRLQQKICTNSLKKIFQDLFSDICFI